MTDSVIVEHKGQMNELSVSFVYFFINDFAFYPFLFNLLLFNSLRDNMQMD